MKSSGVIWITGLPASGKTTVAKALAASFRQRGRGPILIDGDTMRSIMPWSPGYSEVERRHLALFYSRLSQELAGQGHLVICATISLFREVQARNRRVIANFLEVWLRVPDDERQLREAKRTRTRSATTNSAERVVGRDLDPEFPETPDVIIDNWGPVLPADACEMIRRAWDRP